MMIIATTAIADSPVFPYSLQVTGEHGNPWSLPQTPHSASGFQQMSKTRGQQYQGRQIEKYNRRFRFVTPEILESIKQQQIQTQLMPENKQHPLMPRQSLQHYANPSFGTGLTNPLYDTPAASPWSSGSDILYGGESFHFAPKEATGGLSPIHIPPFGKNNGVDESGNTNIQKETNIFNPFNFGHYRNLP